MQTLVISLEWTLSRWLDLQKFSSDCQKKCGKYIYIYIYDIYIYIYIIYIYIIYIYIYISYIYHKYIIFLNYPESEIPEIEHDDVMLFSYDTT